MTDRPLCDPVRVIEGLSLDCHGLGARDAVR